MRKIVFIAIALIAALATGCKSTGNEGSATEGADSLSRVPSGAIAFVRMDTLQAKYNMAVELIEAFQDKSEKAERDLTSRGNTLQSDMLDYRDKVNKGLLLRSQMAEQEEALAKRQQNLMAYRDRMATELGEEQLVINNQIMNAISEYLEEYNADYRYGMIVMTTSQGPILAADPMLDITNEVLEELNKRYAAEK